ncbi:MAG: DUF2007 domain-containing protein [Flavobacterium sp.]|nr:DUF2007 domain-containing protein [Flavobacterium sp.]
MGLIKIFSGTEILALGLKEKLEENSIVITIRNNNQSNVLPSLSNTKAVELFIQETDFSKANPIIEEFRMSI